MRPDVYIYQTGSNWRQYRILILYNMTKIMVHSSLLLPLQQYVHLLDNSLCVIYMCACWVYVDTAFMWTHYFSHIIQNQYIVLPRITASLIYINIWPDLGKRALFTNVHCSYNIGYYGNGIKLSISVFSEYLIVFSSSYYDELNPINSTQSSTHWKHWY